MSTGKRPFPLGYIVSQPIPIIWDYVKYFPTIRAQPSFLIRLAIANFPPTHFSGCGKNAVLNTDFFGGLQLLFRRGVRSCILRCR
ncbi:hypothetical protein [Cruoricaptor ignavus]|uniref:hypothetical protein n=1 Tax=Cruoricaptor ignavus TaxID=1118202 RepID=UPI00135660B3|nr:hypothetical protein [Cruoricaptor ignavus]